MKQPVDPNIIIEVQLPKILTPICLASSVCRVHHLRCGVWGFAAGEVQDDPAKDCPVSGPGGRIRNDDDSGFTE